MFALCAPSWVQKGTIARWAESTLLACGTAFVTFLVFGRQYTSSNGIPGLTCAPLPLLLWAAVRFGVAGVSASTLIVALISICDTMHHWGPLTGTSTAENVLSLHILLAAFASVSMLLAAVVAERRRDEKSLRVTRQELIDSAERERRRIARELHDDIVQRLILLELELQRLESESDPVLRQDLSQLREQLCSTSEATRGVSHQLHPFLLEYLGLEKALRSLCRQTGTQCCITVNFSSEKVPAGLPFDVCLCLYRVVQEALQNIVKHSQARVAAIELRATHERAFLRIADDGIGMDPEEHRAKGMGIPSMRERVITAQGTLRISSAPSRGTTIEVSVPLVPLAKK
jgi:signal transduction histidine kinase